MRLAGLILMATLTFATLGHPLSRTAASGLVGSGSDARANLVAFPPAGSVDLAPAVPFQGRGLHESALESEETDTDASIADLPVSHGLADTDQPGSTAPNSTHPDPHRSSRSRPLRC